MANTYFNKEFKNTNEKTKAVLIFSLVFNLTLNCFAQGGIRYLISLINTLQIILHFPIFSISWPAPIMNFYSTIVPFVMFDIVESFDELNE